MIFFTTLNQVAVLLSFIAIGFILVKCKVLDSNSSAILSKLENNVFVPCLVLGTFINNFTVETIKTASQLLLISTIIILVMMPLAVLIAKSITKEKFLQNIFTYGLAFSNFGFMGNAVVSALFPEFFFEYIIFTLPPWVMIYLWGVPVLLIPSSDEKRTFKDKIKPFLNPMFVAMFIGIIIGLSGIKLPEFITSVISVSGSCMSPVAMILTGITVSALNARKTFTDLRIITVSVIRLVAIPAVFLLISRFINFSPLVFSCALCMLSMPLGLNTIVVPSAYGKDVSAATGMTVISHLLSAITIPVIFSMVNM